MPLGIAESMGTVCLVRIDVSHLSLAPDSQLVPDGPVFELDTPPLI